MSQPLLFCVNHALLGDETLDNWKLSSTDLWYNYDKVIRLYHGTSSCLVNKIVEDRLTPSKLVGLPRVYAAARAYGIEIDQRFQKRIDRNYPCGFPWYESGDFVCLSTCQYHAAGYAARNHMEGGEFNALFRHDFRRFAKRRLPNLYPSSKAVVVEFLLPVRFLDEDAIKEMKGLRSTGRGDVERLRGLRSEVRFPFVDAKYISKVMLVPENFKA